MAIIKKDGNYMGLPMNIARGNPIPLDTTEIWYNKTDMENYAKTGATAYVGQILGYVDEENSSATAYIITNTAGDLQEVGAATFGDNKTITLKDGVLSLYVPEGTALENGMQPSIGTDGKLKWAMPDTTTVEGLSNSINAINDKLNSYGAILNFAGSKTAEEFANLKAENYDAGDVILVTDTGVEYVCVEDDTNTKKWEQFGDDKGVVTLTNTVAELKNSVDTLQLEVGTPVGSNDLFTEVETLKSTTSDHENRIKTIEEFDKLQQQTNTQVDTQLTNLNNTKLDTSVFNTFKESNTTALDGKVNTADLEPYAKTADIDTTLKDYVKQTEFGVVSSDVSTLQSTVNGIQNTLEDTTTGLKPRVTTLEGKVGSTEDTAATDGSIYARIAKNKSDIAEVSDLANNNMSAIGQVDGKVTQLETSVGTSEDTASETGSIYARITKNKDDISALSTTVSNNKTTCEQNLVDAKTELKGTESDASDKITIYGVKKYTTEQISTVSSNLTKLKNDIGNLKNIMNFVGTLTKDDQGVITSEGVHGDVGIIGDKEYVFVATNPEESLTTGTWHELGDVSAQSEGITALQERATALEKTVNGYDVDEVHTEGLIERVNVLEVLPSKVSGLEGDVVQEIENRKTAVTTLETKITDLLTWGEF